MKRVVDVVIAVVALIATLPLIAMAVVAIRITMGSPVLFRQQRIGLDAAPFEILKFRTMAAGAGSDVDRLTRVGRYLRAASVDELPQLINVLRGEMSLVGPRPLLPEYVPLYSARQMRRHDVRPGITGLAQVSGRNDLGWAERLETDVRYVEQQSVRLDLGILFRTIQKVAGRDGVTSAGAPMKKFQGER